MTGFLWAIVAFLAGLGMTALGDMVSEEIRDRLDHLPHAILRLAARRLHPEQRITVYEDEWLPELAYILKGDQARPITRLVHGTNYALGILVNTSRITRHLNRPLTQQIQRPPPQTSLASPQVGPAAQVAFSPDEVVTPRASQRERSYFDDGANAV